MLKKVLSNLADATGGGRDLTLKQCRQSRDGYSSMSPVLMLKQAPCQGQRSLSPLKTPAIAEVWKAPCPAHYHSLSPL